MPLPLIAGITATIIPVAKLWLASRVALLTFKIGSRLFILSIIMAAFYAVLTAIKTASVGLATSAPAAIQTFYTWIVPSNFSACMSAIITVQLIIWAWHWKMYAFNTLTGSVN